MDPKAIADVIGDGIPRGLIIGGRKPLRCPSTAIPFPHLAASSRPAPTADPDAKADRITHRTIAAFTVGSGRARTQRRWRRTGRR